MDTDKKMMTRAEFLKEEGAFSFCLDPLDVNVAKMHKWIDREVRLWQEGQAYSTTEYWVARNPEREISKVSITVQQTTACCTITVRVTDKPLRYIAERTVWTGTLDELKRQSTTPSGHIRLTWWSCRVTTRTSRQYCQQLILPRKFMMPMHIYWICGNRIWI